MARLQRAGTPLDLEERLTHPRSPLRSVLVDCLLSPHAGPSTFILDQQDEHSKLLGLAQMRTRPGRPERDVVFMAPSLDAGNGSHAVWQRLLSHICVRTAERGGLRIYARLPLQSEELRIFRNVGFLEYTQENIYQLDQEVDRDAVRSDLELRRQQSSDGWGLQKLYATLTPRPVQNAEGLAQGQWALTHRRWGEQGRRHGYVWEVGGELLGALHIRAGKCGYWIRTLLHPDALDKSDALCRAALKLTAKNAALPVYFAFRQYEAGWTHVLPESGFQPLTGQILVVKPMTVRLREQSSKRLEAALEASTTEGAAASMIRHSKIASPGAKNGRRKRRGQNILIFTF